MQVRDLVDDNPDLELTVAAGVRELDTAITWVATTEVDDVTGWVDGGELLLMMGSNITRQEDQQRRYVRNLKENGIAALGFGTGIRHRVIPKALLDEADRVGLPVVEVPYHIPFVRITHAVFGALNDERDRVLEDALRVSNELTRLVVRSGDSLTATMGFVSQELGARLELRDTVTRQVIAEAGSRPRGRVEQQVELEFEDSTFPLALTAAKEGTITEFDHQVLRHLQSAVMYEFARRNAVDVARLRLAGDLLTDIARGSLTEAELTTRLGAFGLAPDAAFAALHIIDDTDDGEEILRKLTRALGDLRRSYLATTSQHAVTLLARVGDVEQAACLAAEFLRYVPTARIGVGRVAKGLDLGTSLMEARTAVAESRGQQVVTYRDLQSFGPLLAVPPNALKLYVDDVLGGILDNEKLLATVEALAQHGGHWGNAAEALQVHRHTLRYRANQIRQFTGLDPDSPDHRSQLWMAVAALRIVRLREAGHEPRGDRPSVTSEGGDIARLGG
ncbi:PucR family transcriptional regulator [Ruicaihuangia caeni]|uniref:PucR family transcriptional regulator ligand-binding domain-containing protein n=1 Tax=Ruicaihuangia caeni TaxID=3042517 RepID=A0AAW6T9T1_9MICO|nr:PucR family transcriptional regulator [Klugiella sp. YN-L-19]MDI2099088.1 PucR family transcriptional regulator ligand-binding domain-containing protein [Klugiella sp. YN-L-19]